MPSTRALGAEIRFDRPAGCARTSAGGAAGDDLAEVEHDDVVEMSITMPMSCSTSSTVTPHSSCTSRMKRAMSSVSSRFMPATGSSSSSTRGRIASARASSTRFCRPYGSASDRPVADVVDLEEVDDLALDLGAQRHLLARAAGP